MNSQSLTTFGLVIASLLCSVLAGQPRLRYSHPPMTLAKPHEAGRDLLSMRWGLIPSWWKKTAKEVLSTFNARAETVATKPMFRSCDFHENRQRIFRHRHRRRHRA